MDIITSARSAASKGGAAFLFALLCMEGLSAFASGRAGGLFLLLAMLLLADMAYEDARFLEVDLRKAAALGLLLLVASSEPIGNFLLTALLSLLLFRMVYLLALIRYTLAARKGEGMPKGGEGISALEPLGLLPSLAVAVALFAMLSLLPVDTGLVQGIREALQSLGDAVWEAPWLMQAVLVLWAGLEYGRHLLKRDGGELIEGLGMGDVLVLPLLAAFLGLSAFLAVFFFCMLIHLGRYFIRYIFFHKGA